MMFDCLGYAPDHPDYATALDATRKLLAGNGDQLYCQPCLSPVWDTIFACHALMEVDDKRLELNIRRALDWIAGRQVLDVTGDWAAARPGSDPAAGPFSTRTRIIPISTTPPRRGWRSIASMRCAITTHSIGQWNGLSGCRAGTAAGPPLMPTTRITSSTTFRSRDHGALLDPPTADVTARCLGFLAQFGYERDHHAIAAALAFLRREQENDGSWFGRWGTNYIYGTWSVLAALNAIGIDPGVPEIRRAVTWLLARQHPDGGWGERAESYLPEEPHGDAPYSTPSQTAWALLGLMAAGEAEHPAVARGIAYLLESQNINGEWDEPWYTAVGFPRVFYLRYHGYRMFFPLWALARFRRLSTGNSRRVRFGI